MRNDRMNIYSGGEKMEKIAVLSDIHGNLEALKSCLEDIDQRGIQRIICLGDVIAKGVHPIECLDLLIKRNAIILRGNCDRYFSETHEKVDERIIFNQQMINETYRDFLYHLPMSYECYISGALIRFVHATPTADNAYVGSASSSEDEWKMYLPSLHTSDQIADIVVYGHTHTPYLNKAYHHTLINVGSVGNSIDLYQDEKHPGNHQLTAMAYYMVIEGNLHKEEIGPLSFNHIQVPYDIEKELSSAKINPEKEAYEKELRFGLYRDIKYLRAVKK